MSVCPRSPKKLMSEFKFDNRKATKTIQKLYQCYNCSYTAKRKSYLISHVAKHLKQNDENVCEQCSKKFKTNRHLRDHVRRNHLYNDLHCYHCSYTTKLKFLLDKHVQRHLNPLAAPIGSKYTCLLCTEDEGKYECTERQYMLRHYVRSHGVCIETRKLNFGTIEKFYDWKANLEKVDLCRYVSRGGVRRTAECNIHWFRCFRDGVYKSKSTGKRKLKNKGSLKINSICPSSIRAVEEKDTGSVHVNFIPVHVGHGKELELLNLSTEEKKELAEQLAANIPFNAVLASLRSSMNDGGGVERIHLTTRKDLWNIRRSFKVEIHHSSSPFDIETLKPENNKLEPVKSGKKAYTPLSKTDIDHDAQKNLDGSTSIDVHHQTPKIDSGLLQVLSSPNTHIPSKNGNCGDMMAERKIFVDNVISHSNITPTETDNTMCEDNGEASVEAWITTMKSSEPSIVRFYESQAPLLAENPESDSTSYILNDELSDRKKLLIDELLKLLDSATTEADLNVLENHLPPVFMAAHQEIYKNHSRIPLGQAEDVATVVCQTMYED